MFYRYRLHELDGNDAGEAHYAFLVKPGEPIVLGSGRKVRVVDVVPVEEEGSPFVGMLGVEAVWGSEQSSTWASSSRNRQFAPRLFGSAPR
jgi:hypothetical protein